MTEFSAYVGLDVHKDTIAVAVALPGREEPVYRGEIKNQRKSLHRLIRSLSPHGEVVSSSSGSSRGRNDPPDDHATGRRSRQGPARSLRAPRGAPRQTLQPAAHRALRGARRSSCTGARRPTPAPPGPDGSACSTPPADDRGRTHAPALPPHIFALQRQRQHAVVAKPVVIVEILVAQGQAIHPLPNKRLHTVLGSALIAVVGKTPRQTSGQIQHSVRRTKQDRAAVRRHPPPVELADDFTPSQPFKRQIDRISLCVHGIRSLVLGNALIPLPLPWMRIPCLQPLVSYPG